MRNLFFSLTLAVFCVPCSTCQLFATGDFAPGRWLENGGVASDMAPEFYWELELKRMARDFAPPEKRVPAVAAESAPSDDEKAASPKLRGESDAADFEDALKAARIKPADASKAKAQYERARQIIGAASETTAGKLPEEFASEFADYHRGAFAFRLGKEHYGEAREAWEALLRRPEEERHYRSVWAAFMLGKLALKTNSPDAVKWFRETRELAKKGFADSAGLAADSYGWEARAELRKGGIEAAAKLYLTQLALGDESAVISLKALIPDRPLVEGMLNYGEEPPEDLTEEERKAWEAKRLPAIQKKLDDAARSPLLRRLITAHILATETQAEQWDNPTVKSRCARWLTTLENSKLQKVDDADHLGWVAYTAGRYKEAERWLKIANADSAMALWLAAKLERRAGKTGEAVRTMARAFEKVKNEKVSVTPSGDFTHPTRGYLPEQSGAGDLAGLHLARGEFVSAMHVFLQNGLEADAVFIGDRILSADELKSYVDEHSNSKDGSRNPQQDEPLGDKQSRFRWMLARRLVREDRYAEARPYFQAKEQAALDRYLIELKAADNPALGKTERARALFNAAWIARYDGMKLMATEVEPDGFNNNGMFPPGNLDTERREGVLISEKYSEAKKEEVQVKKPVKLSIAATAEEKLRIAKFKPQPNARYHYRYIAAGLAWKAAALLADGSEELADVLYTGGSWIKNRDEKSADKFIQAIEKRCPKTKIGAATLAKHWFVDGLPGPWSGPLSKQRDENQ